MSEGAGVHGEGGGRKPQELPSLVRLPAGRRAASRLPLDTDTDRGPTGQRHHLATTHPRGRFHRQAVMARFQDPRGELAYVAEALEEDAKNYHVWAYR